MQIYREALHPNGKVIYISKHSKHGAPGPLHGKPISAPCGPLEGMQQKRLAARRHKTTYAYDFPTVFGNALREIWTTRAISGEPGSVPKGMYSCVPRTLPWQPCLGGTPKSPTAVVDYSHTSGVAAMGLQLQSCVYFVMRPPSLLWLTFLNLHSIIVARGAQSIPYMRSVCRAAGGCGGAGDASRGDSPAPQAHGARQPARWAE